MNLALERWEFTQVQSHESEANLLKRPASVPSMVDGDEARVEEILRRLGELDQKVEYLIEAMHDFRYRKPPRLENQGGREE